jgi:hypothetical protein
MTINMNPCISFTLYTKKVKLSIYQSLYLFSFNETDGVFYSLQIKSTQYAQNLIYIYIYSKFTVFLSSQKASVNLAQKI